MLSRLRMTTEEALTTYNSVASAIFSKGNQKHKHQNGTFKASTLEAKVRELVEDKHLGERMLDTSADTRRAKAFVCAMPARNTAHPRRFRTYQARENPGPNCLIWEACRATIAAPTIFKRISIGEEGRAKEEFIDGGIRCNNPINQVIEESQILFKDDVTLRCLISIGTGHLGIIGLSKPDSFQKIPPTKLIAVLRGAATDCELVAENVAKRFKNHDDYFFRYNVTHGAGSISLEERGEMADVETHTKDYLEQGEISGSINKIVSILTGTQELKSSYLTLRSLCQSQFYFYPF